MRLPDTPVAVANSPIKRVAILFAGGPAPAANAVISTCAASFLRQGISVVGVLHGYAHLVEYAPEHPLEAGRDYIELSSKVLRRTRNTQGILIGTSRTNPGRGVSEPSHLTDAERVAPLRTVYDALRSIGVDALISVGGDDTLKSANKFKLFQQTLPDDAPRIPVVHIPKTIDNDYSGIDFTFGYFTAVDTLASEVRNLLADAEATRSYFIAETMGRSAGWLAYGVAIAGEASLVMSLEDIVGQLVGFEDVIDKTTGELTKRRIMNLEAVVQEIVETIRVRHDQEGKEFGVIVLSEGLTELLPQRYLEGVSRDDHGHIAMGKVNLAGTMSRLVMEEYKRQTGKERRIVGLQLGYESRCARPHAFDVMLGSQLGVGAYRALVEDRRDGVMVSVSGQLQLNYVPFDDLVDPQTLVTRVRYVTPGCDFHRLARFLETHINK